MPDLTVAPLGPLFGPDFIIITVNDSTLGAYNLEVYPDANNPQLKANRLRRARSPAPYRRETRPLLCTTISR